LTFKGAAEATAFWKAAEELIFSVGGRNPGHWRTYLKDNYPQQW